MLGILMLLFSKAKYDEKHQPRDYNSKKYKLLNISTIVLDNQMSCYVKSGDSTVVDFKYWGNDEVLPDMLRIKNDTLYLDYQFNKSGSSIHLYCKNVKKIIVKNESIMTINQFASEALNVSVLNKSHVMLECRENMKDDSTRNSLNINFILEGQSSLGISNSTVNDISVVANNSILSFYKSKFNSVNVDLKSGSDFYEWDTKCSEIFQIKSDNNSKYHIQYNKNEKK